MLNNVNASELPPIDTETFDRIHRLYRDKVKPIVHHLW